MRTLSTGKQLRLSRFHFAGHRTGLIVPIDHGLTMGPLAGLTRTSEIARWIGHSAIRGVIAHKGMVERLAAMGVLGGKGVILHLNGMSTLAANPNQKELLTSVEAAARMGVDGVSVQVNFDGKNDSHNMRLLGQTVDEAQRFGLPVLTMIYDKVQVMDDEKQVARLNHLVRIGIELGSDAIKLSPPRSLSEMGQILENASEDVEIYFAGGDLMKDNELVALASEAVALGAAGLCVGRNVFQRKNPAPILTQLEQILIHGTGIESLGSSLFAAQLKESYEHH